MPPTITSATNPKIQRIRALLEQSKVRRAENAFVIEGVRLMEEAARAAWQAESVFFTDQLSQRGIDLLHSFAAAGAELYEIPAHLMEQIAGTESPQGILGVFQQRTLPLPNPLNFVLIADGLRDPGNLGTLLRTAAAAGAQAVLLAPGCAGAFAPKVLRGGMGAHFQMPILHKNWDEIRALCKEQSQPALTLYMAEMQNAQECWQCDFTRPLALVIGAEAEGATPEARALIDESICIPMPGKSESLNAAIAAGILLFEVVRQRHTA